MGSSLVQAYVATWGALIEEKTLAAASDTITISNIPTGFKYLHIFLNVKSNAALGAVPFQMDVNGGTGTFGGTYSFQAPPNVLTVTNYAGAAGWVCCPMGDSTQNTFSEYVINQDPAIVIKSVFVRSEDPNNSNLYMATNNVVLAPGETTINEVRIYTILLGDKFNPGSKMAIYGVN